MNNEKETSGKMNSSLEQLRAIFHRPGELGQEKADLFLRGDISTKRSENFA